MTAPSHFSRFLREATAALGAEVGREVARRLVDSLTENPGSQPTISAMALRNYARGGVFGQLSRSQVEAYLATRLAAMDPHRADMILRAASVAGGGTVDGTLRQVALVFAEEQGELSGGLPSD